MLVWPSGKGICPVGTRHGRQALDNRCILQTPARGYLCNMFGSSQQQFSSPFPVFVRPLLSSSPMLSPGTDSCLDKDWQELYVSSFRLFVDIPLCLMYSSKGWSVREKSGAGGCDLNARTTKDRILSPQKRYLAAAVSFFRRQLSVRLGYRISSKMTKRNKSHLIITDII